MLKRILACLLLVVFTSGCAALIGGAAGPVTGLISCTKEAVKDAQERHNFNEGSILGVIFSPVIGIFTGFGKGLMVDVKMLKGETTKEDIAGVFDPCKG